MNTTIVMTVISVAGVAFMVRFFMALCRDGHGRACHVVHIVQGVAGQYIEVPLKGSRRELAEYTADTANNKQWAALVGQRGA